MGFFFKEATTKTKTFTIKCLACEEEIDVFDISPNHMERDAYYFIEDFNAFCKKHVNHRIIIMRPFKKKKVIEEENSVSEKGAFHKRRLKYLICPICDNKIYNFSIPGSSKICENCNYNYSNILHLIGEE